MQLDYYQSVLPVTCQCSLYYLNIQFFYNDYLNNDDDSTVIPSFPGEDKHHHLK